MIIRTLIYAFAMIMFIVLFNLPYFEYWIWFRLFMVFGICINIVACSFELFRLVYVERKRLNGSDIQNIL
jgi:hypothetical protein